MKRSEKKQPDINPAQAASRWIQPGVWLLMLAVVIVPLIGCRQETPTLPDQTSQAGTQTRNEVVVYFTKSRGTEPVTEGVVRHIPADYTGSDLEYAIRELLAGPNEEESLLGFFSEIPKGTRLIAVSEENGKVKVDLSRQFTSGGGANSMQQRLAEMKQTILEAEQSKDVFLSVEGELLETLAGEGVEVGEPLKPDNIQ